MHFIFNWPCSLIPTLSPALIDGHGFIQEFIPMELSPN